MEQSPEALQARLDSVAASFVNLSQQVVGLATRLDNGEPPDEAFIDALAAGRAAFHEIRDDIHALAREPVSSPPGSLKDLRESLMQIIEAAQRANEDEVRCKATEILDQVLAITCLNTPDFEPLLVCQQTARDLRNRITKWSWPEMSAEAESLISGQHPLAHLITLITAGEDVDDDSWDASRDFVETRLGRALGTAAVRGRLKLEPRPAPVGDDELLLHNGRLSQDDQPKSRPSVGPVSPAPGGRFAAAPSEDPAHHLAGLVGPLPRVSLPPIPSSPSQPYLYPWQRPDRGTLANPVQKLRETTESGASLRSTVKLQTDEEVVRELPLDGDSGTSTVLPGPSEGRFQPNKEEATTEVDHGVESVNVVVDPAAPLGTAGLQSSDDGLATADVAASPVTEAIPEIDAAPKPAVTAVDPGHSPAPAPTEPAHLEVVTAQRLAWAIREGSVADPRKALSNLIWSLVAEDRLGLAYHLAQALEIGDTPALDDVPSCIIHALQLGRVVRYDAGEIAASLRASFAELSNNASVPDEDRKRAIGLLLIAAALRPTLLAPNTGAAAVLHDARTTIEGLPQLYAYAGTIATFGEKGQAVDASALKKVKDKAAWQDELDELRREVEAWFAQAPSMRTVYAPATDVWRKWSEPSGLLARVLRPVREDDTSTLSDVKREIHRLLDEDEFRREVDRATRRGPAQRREPIQFDAFEQLRKNQRKALSLAQRWVELREARPDAHPSYLQIQAERLREAVWQQQDEVLAELRALADHTSSLVITAAAECGRRAVDDIRSLFDPETPLPPDEPSPRDLLHADLLRAPAIALDARWEPLTESEDLIDAVVGLTADNTSWRAAFVRHSDAQDHEATERILNYLSTQPSEAIDVDIDSLRQERLRHLRYCREALSEAAGDTSREIEGAVALGLLQEREREKLAGRVERVRSAIPNTLTFRSLHDALQLIRNEIAQKRSAEVAAVLRRFKSEPVRRALEGQQGAEMRIQTVLNEGDVSSANEYIDMMLAGQGIPEPVGERDAFHEFFIDQFASIAQYLDPEGTSVRATERRLVEEIGEGKSTGPVSLHRVPGAQTKQASRMLSVWYTVKKQRAISEVNAGDILTVLGFTNVSATVRRDGQRTWLDVTTDSIRDRDRCPVHVYGSSADGRYRILCVWNRPNEEDLLNDIGETAHGAPALVFHFGTMTAKRRRDLASLCRHQRRAVVVLDDALLYYLCGERGSRLPVLFACALPFASLNPYTTTAGVVPPEIFYGRRYERSSIEDPMGSCFIYGGRQLGKTALLRDVARTFHDQEAGRVAVWLDLRVEGIGYDRPIDEIWRLVGEQLKRERIVIQPHVEADRLLRQIEDWLDQEPHRRILLLLDEADRFLESDGNEEFRRVARFKGLMDRTNRRFKVVFAGLHNVQRTARGENQPLAHYGEPLRIGPLLDRGEWRAARALIEGPLAAVGYRFESPDLVTRILSRTNYYPSLIQLYCNQLLRHVTDTRSALFDQRTSPPYVIRSRHVDDAYQNQELRKAIRDRFLWTLDLDPRYRVIAFAIALESTGPTGRALHDGFSVDWIRNAALTYWKEGFRESAAQHVFRELLDEMVGLGILRETSPGQYALRSPNVVALIGTQDEIEQALVESGERHPPVAYAPATFRAAYRNTGDVDRTRRSPLTAQQETELRRRQNGVSIVFGCPAAGLSDVEPFLRSAVGPTFFASVSRVTNRVEFQQRLDAMDLTRRQQDGVTVILVGSDCPWGEPWLTEAAKRVRRLTSRTSFVRIIFLADPRTTWELLDPPQHLDNLIMAGFGTTGLQPWHDAALRHWLQDTEFGPSDQQGWTRISAVTGNWPNLLGHLLGSAVDGARHWDACLADLEASLATREAVAPLEHDFGLDLAIPRQVLGVLAEYGQASSSELVHLLDDNVSPMDVERTLRWADLLALATREGDEQWRVNPLVGRLLAVLNG